MTFKSATHIKHPEWPGPVCSTELLVSCPDLACEQKLEGLLRQTSHHAAAAAALALLLAAAAAAAAGAWFGSRCCTSALVRVHDALCTSRAHEPSQRTEGRCKAHASVNHYLDSACRRHSAGAGQACCPFAPGLPQMHIKRWPHNRVHVASMHPSRPSSAHGQQGQHSAAQHSTALAG